MKNQSWKQKGSFSTTDRLFRSLQVIGIVAFLAILFCVYGKTEVDGYSSRIVQSSSASALIELDAAAEAEASAEESTYILNTNTKKFHKPDCFSIRHMSESNKVWFVGQREEVLDMGYSPCGHCCP